MSRPFAMSVRLTVLLASLGMALTALPADFNPSIPSPGTIREDRPANAVAVSTPSDRAAMAIVVAGAFRSLACEDFAAAGRRFDPDRKLGFLTNVAVGTLISDTWQRFFAGSFTMGGNMRSDAPLVAFYNPYVDSALFTVWTVSDRGPQLTAAWMVTETPTGGDGPAADSSHGSGQTMVNPYAASRRLSAFTRWFERNHEPFATSRPAVAGATPKPVLTLLNRRLAFLQMQAAEFERLARDVSSGPWEKFQACLAGGDADSLGRMLSGDAAATPEMLLALPLRVRGDLEPGFILRSEHNLVLFSWSPALPSFVIITEYRKGAAWSLADVDVFVLNP